MTIRMGETMDIDPSRFRKVLAHLPTGVTVITARGQEGPVGMAANSVTSVSLDPPLLLFCPAKTSTTWLDIRSSGGFCVNVMAGHHEEITRQFAAKGVDRFADIACEDRPAGLVLRDALAWFECDLETEHDAGDHTIAIARVRAMGATSDLEDPLVFFRGAYGSFRGAAARPSSMEESN